MAAEFAKMFLDRKRNEQGRSSGLETSPAPSPYQRYGVSVEIPLRSGKFTGNGEDGVLDPTMPTERRIAVNGRPYAVDEGEVVVINAETVKAYGGPENLDRYIQSHRSDSNYQEMGPREEAPQDPRITRGAGQAPASMMNQQFSTGGIPSRNIRPYDSQFEILKDVQGGMPRMGGGGWNTLWDIVAPGTRQVTKVVTGNGSGNIVTDAGNILSGGLNPVGLPSVQNIGTALGQDENKTGQVAGQILAGGTGGLINKAQNSAGNWLSNKFDTIKDRWGNALSGATDAVKNIASGVSSAASNITPAAPSDPVSPPAAPVVEEPERKPIKSPEPITNITYGAPPVVTQGVRPPPVVNPPAGQPVLSPSKLDEMILDSYLTRMGGMSESERAAEEQRLMQQGVSPEAIRGQVAMSDVSRRSAMGQAAEQFATGAAQREQTLNQQNRTFEETRRQNEERKLENMPVQMKNDAGSMSEASWLAKYPTATHDDYLVASGQNVTPATRFQTWSQAMTSLQNTPGVTEEQLLAQWNIGANDPTLAPYMSTMQKPDFGAIATQANPTIDNYASALIRFGVGKEFANSPTYQNDMRDFAESILTSGGTIDPKTGQFTFGDDPVSLPWDNPDKWYQYTDFDGKDVPDGVNTSDPAWLAGTVVVNGKPVVRSDLVTWWNDDATPTEKLNIINGTKTVGDYYGEGGGTSQIPTSRSEWGSWWADPDNTEVRDAYDAFVEGLAANPIPIIGPDGKVIEPGLLAGNQNLPWIWSQLQNKVNGGDYTKGLNTGNVAPGSYSVDDQGNLTAGPTGGYSSSFDPATVTSYDNPSYDAFALNPDNQGNGSHTIVKPLPGAGNDAWVIPAFEDNMGGYVSINNGGKWTVYKVLSRANENWGSYDHTAYQIQDPVTGKTYTVKATTKNKVEGLPAR